MVKQFTARLRLLSLLATMPTEAFQWLTGAIARDSIWPSGTGGFKADSRRSIAAVKKEALKLFETPDA